MAIINIVISKLGVKSAASIIMMGRVGIIRNRSTILIRSSSIAPPKYPDTNPTMSPNTTPKKVATSPTYNETCAPHNNCAKTSCPLLVVPSTP